MNITITESRTYPLNWKQATLIKSLARRGSRYLHNRLADLADGTPGVVDIGEGKYQLNSNGRALYQQLAFK